MNVIEIWTDGASRGNPGPGAYAALFYFGDDLHLTLSDYKEHTTNNEMELTALKEALERLLGFDVLYDNKFQYNIYSDSSYVVDGYNKWLDGWIKSNSLQDKANYFIWKSIVNSNDLIKKRGIKVTVNKVKGHAGIPKNEAADKECNRLMDENTRMPEPEKVLRVSGDFIIQKSENEVIITSEPLRSLNGHKVEFTIKLEQLLGKLCQKI